MNLIGFYKAVSILNIYFAKKTFIRMIEVSAGQTAEGYK